MNDIIVDLGNRSYPIYIGSGTLSAFGEVCQHHDLPNRIAVITDRQVAKLHLPLLTNSLRHQGFEIVTIITPAGERQKSMARAADVFTQLTKEKFTRNSAIIAFGGGVVGDLSGFVAATFRRGIAFVQVPTTLLAQVESSVGGKVAVNHAQSKNIIGAFYQPKFVFSDIRLLSTLPQREIICGLGEILKYAYLSEEMFAFIDGHVEKILAGDVEGIEETVRRCNTMKARMIEEDERELIPNGGRMVLNLGHTIGHVLENLSNYKLHHGEAVLIGLRWELSLARNASILSDGEFNRINRMLDRVDFTPKCKLPTTDQIMKAITVKAGTVKFILPKKIGEIIATKEIDASLLRTTLKSNKNR